MEALHIGARREVCWDEYLIDTADAVRVQMHRPQRRNVVLTCDKPWEGNCCGYFVLVPDGEHFRLYYQCEENDVDEQLRVKPCHRVYIAYAVSDDGKTFTRVPLGHVPYWGSADNNLLTEDVRDNMFVFRDPNRACPPDEAYKALIDRGGQVLWYDSSADGVNWVRRRVLVDDGAYDSMNVALWDADTEQYFLFYRGLHGASADGKWGSFEAGKHHRGVIRDVRVRTSKDFVTCSKPMRLDFGPDAPDLELYTNQVQKYCRAEHMFIGFPARYIDRVDDPAGFPQLPDWPHRRRLIAKYGRTGTAMTDCAIMTSRDGLHFRRTEEAFLTAGIERGTNWYYGDGFLCYGMARTKADIPCAPDELSLYMGEDYRVKGVSLRRFSIRLDGFFSWRADSKPGRVVTKPITFTGDRLEMNFATSAFGSVRIRILDADGTPIPGYDSGNHFGDSVDRQVSFALPLGALAAKPVRLEITMKDADLYSFRFTQDVKIC